MKNEWGDVDAIITLKNQQRAITPSKITESHNPDNMHCGTSQYSFCESLVKIACEMNEEMWIQ